MRISSLRYPQKVSTLRTSDNQTLPVISFARQAYSPLFSHAVRIAHPFLFVPNPPPAHTHQPAYPDGATVTSRCLNAG